MKTDRLSITQVIKMARPNWWSLTVLPFIAGALLTGQPVTAVTYIGLIYFLLPYNLALYGINDMYDRKNDAINPRKQKSVLDKKYNKFLWQAILLLNIPFIIYFVVVGSLFSGLFLASMVGLILAYSGFGFRYKEVPVMASVNSAFLYSAPFVFAILLFNGFESWVGIFSTFFTWAVATHLFSSVQDATFEKEHKISSLSAKMGVRNTLIISTILYAVATVMPFLFYDVFGLIGVVNGWLQIGLVVSAFSVVPYLLLAASNLVGYKKETAGKRAAKAQKMLMALDVIVGLAILAFVIYLYTR